MRFCSHAKRRRVNVHVAFLHHLPHLLVQFAVSAHALHHFDFQEAGVNCARKGWLPAKNLLNTRTLVEIKEFLD